MVKLWNRKNILRIIYDYKPYMLLMSSYDLWSTEILIFTKEKGLENGFEFESLGM